MSTNRREAWAKDPRNTPWARRWFAIHRELEHARRLRRLLLAIELTAKGVPYMIGGDAICVYVDRQWWDIYPYDREKGHRVGHYLWVVDYPHDVLDDESHTGHDIAWPTGFRFDVTQLPALLKAYNAD